MTASPVAVTAAIDALVALISTLPEAADATVVDEPPIAEPGAVVIGVGLSVDDEAPVSTEERRTSLGHRRKETFDIACEITVGSGDEETMRAVRDTACAVFAAIRAAIAENNTFVGRGSWSDVISAAYSPARWENGVTYSIAFAVRVNAIS